MLISAFRTGNFEISIYNSLENIISGRWDEMKSKTLNSDYLQFIEESKPGDLKFRYVFIEEITGDKKKICGILYFQILKFTKKNIHFNKSILLSLLAGLVLKFRPFNFLICGNLFAVNFPAICFNEDKINRNQLLEILTGIQKREKSDVFILKDLDEAFSPSLMEKFNLLPYKSDVTMSLNIDPAWNTIDDYIKCLTKKYKRRTEKIIDAGKKMILKELNAEEILIESKQIKNLFNQVVSKQTVRMGLIGENYFYEYKKRFPEEFTFIGYYFNTNLVAFATYIDHSKILEIHYIGINYNFNKELMIYFNILVNGLERAIQNKKEQLELGRTAREAKANIGGKAVYFNDYININGRLANFLSQKFTAYFQSEMGKEWAEKHPFRK